MGDLSSFLGVRGLAGGVIRPARRARANLLMGSGQDIGADL